MGGSAGKSGEAEGAAGEAGVSPRALAATFTLLILSGIGVAAVLLMTPSPEVPKDCDHCNEVLRPDALVPPG